MHLTGARGWLRSLGAETTGGAPADQGIEASAGIIPARQCPQAPLPFSRVSGERLFQNSTFTEGALRLASPWYTASMLLPSGSSTNAP